MADLVDEIILNSPTPILFSGHSITVEDWIKQDQRQWLKAIGVVK